MPVYQTLLSDTLLLSLMASLTSPCDELFCSLLCAQPTASSEASSACPVFSNTCCSALLDELPLMHVLVARLLSRIIIACNNNCGLQMQDAQPAALCIP